ncbi:hypothetical protein FGW37_20320 [Streptomyces rectiverticillatus]|uniref:hypothetical protein n=1 Tax=Streptomyces rectiverticillatus TaxID=173860 RepID=UPI0015C3F05D|nr:hypothetical protein [Streptomyces rectiverticillatus]QLE73617.1 hypothetical protein FGW37_20320 [Streptomyces rectiverticillatus]
MNDSDREYQLRLISASGLTVLDAPTLANIPTIEQAWKVVAGWETVPVATVGQKTSDALAELDRQWLAHSSSISLFASDGTILVNVAGRGCQEAGWTPVKWSERAQLASKLQRDGDPEFIAMSIDGRRMCAVTTEEYDYWVVAHQFA